MTLGFILGAEELILGDIWSNSSTLTYINTGYPQDVNISTLNATGVYINNDPVCTQNNGLCSSGTGDNSSWNESKANALYYPLTTNPNGYYNVSTLPVIDGGNVNGSDIFQRNINASGFINSESGLTQHGGVPVIDTQTLFCDFNVPYITTMCYPNYLITIATGVPIKAPNNIISNYRNGVLNFTTTAAVNTGAAINTDPTNFLINGSEMYQAGLRFPMLALTGNKSVVHAGFIDTTATQTESVDGAYFYIVNHTGGGRVANNSVRLYTTTNYTFNTRDWYDMRIDIAPNGTQARFTIYNGSKGASLTPLYQQNITGTNFFQFPQLSGRETGAGIACGITTVGQVMTPCQIDYVHTEIEKQQRPGLMP